MMLIITILQYFKYIYINIVQLKEPPSSPSYPPTNQKSQKPHLTYNSHRHRSWIDRTNEPEHPEARVITIFSSKAQSSIQSPSRKMSPALRSDIRPRRARTTALAAERGPLLFHRQILIVSPFTRRTRIYAAVLQGLGGLRSVCVRKS